MAKLFTEQGWLNYEYICAQKETFNAIVGARGIGKTYGLLQYAAEKNIRFLYIRRLKSQLELSAGRNSNPFRAVNADGGYNIQPVPEGGIITFQRQDADGACIDIAGYGFSLSTVQNVRGIDFSDVQMIVFDEFIAAAGERPIKAEYTAFLNLYETVNRNRELSGKPAVKVYFLGNANRLDNPYFSAWNCTGIILNMIAGNQNVYRKGDFALYCISHSPITARKAETVLYRQAGDADFITMALNNRFNVDVKDVKSLPKSELTYNCGWGELAFYAIRSGGYYVNTQRRDEKHYLSSGIDASRFRLERRYIIAAYLNNNLIFETIGAKLLLDEYLHIR